MNNIDELTVILKKLTKLDDILISQIDINNDKYRKIEICDYKNYIFVPKECDYETTYFIKQIYEYTLKEQKERCEGEEYISCFKSMVMELFDTSIAFAEGGCKVTESFNFLNGHYSYAIIKNDIVILNNNIDKFTLETSILKLKKQDEFSMHVKEGEVYGCKVQNYAAIVSCNKKIEDIIISVLKVRLIYLNKIYENELYLAQLKNVNSVLEQLVKERTEEIECKNKMLQEEKNKLSAANNKLTELNKKLAQLSKTDPLTKLSNRRGLREKFKSEYKKIKDTQMSVSLIMCDIDYFKMVNDTYGHDCGDKVLIKVSDLFRSHLRDMDVIARYGGEEFIIILSESNSSYSFSIAESLRAAVEKEVFYYNNSTFHITMSFGLVNFNNKTSYLKIIKMADEALYEAKHKGRNQVFQYN